MDCIVSRYEDVFAPYVGDNAYVPCSLNECFTQGRSYLVRISYCDKPIMIPLMVGCRWSNMPDTESDNLRGYFVIDGECHTVITQDMLIRSPVDKDGIHIGSIRIYKTPKTGMVVIVDGKTKRSFKLPSNILSLVMQYADIGDDASINISIDPTSTIIAYLASKNIPMPAFISLFGVYIGMLCGRYSQPNPIHKYMSAGPLMMRMLNKGADIMRCFRTSRWPIHYSGYVDGVSERMHMYSYAGDLAALHRISAPVNREVQSIKSRLLDDSHRGMLCCVETNEGTEAGTAYYMCNGIRITKDQRSLVESFLKDRDTNDATDDSGKFMTVVFINSKFYASDMSCDSVNALRNEGLDILIERYGRLVNIIAAADRIIASNTSILGSTAHYLYLRNHNPAVRATFACAQIKQAITQDARVLRTPCTETWYLISGEQPNSGPPFQYPAGHNLLAVFSVFGGYNIEDSYIISESCAIKYRHRKFNVQTITYTSIYDFKAYIGMNVRKGERLVTTICNNPVRKVQHYYSAMTGVVDAIVHDADNGRIRIRIYEERVLEVGDKLCTRHGQKGVISIILPDVEMPIVDGIQSDIIINPHCIPSRETWGQVLEASESGGGVRDVTIPPNRITDACRVRVLSGRVFVLALRHQARSKMQARCTGKYVRGQAVSGKRRGGGLKFGYMEKDVLLSVGAHTTLSTLYSIDMVSTRTCNVCGVVGIECIHDGMYIGMHASTGLVCSLFRILGKDLRYRPYTNDYCIIDLDWDLIRHKRLMVYTGGEDSSVVYRYITQSNESIIIENIGEWPFSLGKAYVDLFRNGNDRNISNLRNVAKELLVGRDGALRRLVESKKLDYCARAVIVPDPKLPIDSISLPLNIDLEHGSALLNRQPTLTRKSLAMVKLLPGTTSCIHINPLLCKQFNADFDGDEMNVYAINEKCRDEVCDLLPVIPTPVQDYVLADVKGVSVRDLVKESVTADEKGIRVMVECGSKGKLVNIQHLFDSVGDVYVQNKLIGTILHSYRDGLTDNEYFIQAQAAREGIVAIGTSVPVSGDAYRRTCRIYGF